MDVLEGVLAIIGIVIAGGGVVGLLLRRADGRQVQGENREREAASAEVLDAFGTGGVSLISNASPQSLQTHGLVAREEPRRRGVLSGIFTAFASGGISLIAPPSRTAADRPQDPGPTAGAGA